MGEQIERLIDAMGPAGAAAWQGGVQFQFISGFVGLAVVALFLWAASRLYRWRPDTNEPVAESVLRGVGVVILLLIAAVFFDSAIGHLIAPEFMAIRELVQ